jgi:hypothetical protein
MEIGVGWFLYPPNVALLLPFDAACCFACPPGVGGTDQAREKRKTFDDTIRGLRAFAMLYIFSKKIYNS